MEVNFAEFIQAVKKNAWWHFLDDKGKGSPPKEYLWLVELGLRKYASDVHAMGTNPLRSRKRWENVAPWRKREAYIAVGRHLLGEPADYKTWTSFRWTDYHSRKALGRTFIKRHLPKSDGQDDTHFGGDYKFDWDKHSREPRTKTKRVVASASASASVASKNMERPMMYDIEKDCMVPFE